MALTLTPISPNDPKDIGDRKDFWANYGQINQAADNFGRSNR